MRFRSIGSGSSRRVYPLKPKKINRSNYKVPKTPKEEYIGNRIIYHIQRGSSDEGARQKAKEDYERYKNT